MSENVLSINISEIIYASLAHIVQCLANENGVIDCAEAGLLKNNYRYLSPDMKRILDAMTSDIVNTLEQHHEQTYTDAERYRLLPCSIREFIESGPSDMFVLGSKMTEAIKSRDVLYQIHRLSMFEYGFCSSNKSTSFLDKTRKILRESGLTPFSD